VQDLGQPVGAVQGRVTSRVAAGTNGLLRAGASPIRDAGRHPRRLLGTSERQSVSTDKADRLSDELRGVLDAVELGEGVGL
jgi:predicted Rossmann fold nucleotide-binding protein DprA/Smf involved in DNA uptake